MAKSKKMQIRDRIKELRRVKAGDLRPNPKNWRTHPKAQQDALRGVLAEVGYADALLARELPDGGLMLVDGHLRAEATPDALVPVLILDVTEAEADKILATLDPLAAMAEADSVKLDALLATIDTESEALLKMLDDVAKDAGCESSKQTVDEDDVPEVPKTPVTKPGDLWLLGNHRLVCGDSTKAEDVARVMNGELADLCFTSPPYGQQRDYTAESKEMIQDWYALMCGVFAILPMAPAGQVLVNLGMIHRDNEWIPYWEPWIEWMRTQGWRRFGWYVWDQGFGLPGDWNGRLAPSHEFVFHFNREAVRPEKWVDKQPENIKPRNAGESTMRGKDGKTKAFTNPAASGQPTKIPDSIIHVGRQVGSDGHPAQFPVGLPAFAMQSWGGLAFEPFMGSGTTIIAAEQLGRRCFGLELSGQYVDVCCERWARLTGGEPILSETGETFAQVKARRVDVRS